jgi:LysM repeat protein
MKWILFVFLPFITYSQIQKVEEKKINIDSLLQTKEYEGIEIEKHTVKKGERMRNIYLKYKITPGEIYRLNPEAKDSLKVGSVLLIPLQKKVVYREWLNPNWVKQNEAKLLRELKVKDSLAYAKRIAITKKLQEEKELKKNKNNPKKNNSKKVETKKVETPISITKVEPIEKEKNIKKTQDSIAKQIKDDYFAKIDKENTDKKIKDSIAISELSKDESSNKKSKKSKKEKKEIKYGTPDDHDVFLDPKNKEHYILHEIEEDETLISIAKKYNVPDYALLEFNKRVDFKKVMAGNLMKVPNVEKEVVQSYIFDLIAAYKTKNIKYDKDVTKKKFTYTNDDDE